MKNVILATVLSIVFPGIGQIYNGQNGKGVSFIAAILLFMSLNMATSGYPLFAVFYVVAWVWSLVDAIVVAVKQQKGSIPAPPLEGERRYVKLGLAIVVAYLLFFTSACAFDQTGTDEGGLALSKEEKKIQQEAKKYLENKYHEEFVVEKPNYIPAIDKYGMYAYPKNDPDIVFGVTKLGSDPFLDTYLESVWDRDSKEELESVLPTFFDHLWNFSTSISVKDRIETEIAGKKIPSYRELRKAHPDQITNTMTIYLIKNVTDQNQDEELEKVLKFINYCEKNDIRIVNLEINYYDEALLNKSKEKINIKNQDKFDKYYRNRLGVYIDNPSKYKSIEDLKEDFVNIPN
ncbi:hypothetical protein [Lihuaxuella thermophila]|uniref:TM2 domain-containing protein n=1 Tax=Lihuaxuella thermophila TaxID=1173111 RepID=A0A1H8I4B6_9BACL|nr:hypothetical protein [Lihuaxuella thermophila]SEN62955.1 hypothetical protein SAMN05444955_1163 [Lihuaxuella thermophila]